MLVGSEKSPTDPEACKPPNGVFNGALMVVS